MDCTQRQNGEDSGHASGVPLLEVGDSAVEADIRALPGNILADVRVEEMDEWAAQRQGQGTPVDMEAVHTGVVDTVEHCS